MYSDTVVTTRNLHLALHLKLIINEQVEELYRDANIPTNSV